MASRSFILIFLIFSWSSDLWAKDCGLVETSRAKASFGRLLISGGGWIRGPQGVAKDEPAMQDAVDRLVRSLKESMKDGESTTIPIVLSATRATGGQAGTTFFYQAYREAIAQALQTQPGANIQLSTVPIYTQPRGAGRATPNLRGLLTSLGAGSQGLREVQNARAVIVTGGFPANIEHLTSNEGLKTALTQVTARGGTVLLNSAAANITGEFSAHPLWNGTRKAGGLGLLPATVMSHAGDDSKLPLVPKLRSEVGRFAFAVPVGAYLAVEGNTVSVEGTSPVVFFDNQRNCHQILDPKTTYSVPGLSKEGADIRSILDPNAH